MGAEELTREEVRLRRAAIAFAVLFVVLAAGYLLQGFFAGAEFPFVANSTAKDGLFALLCWVGAADVRRNLWAIGAVLVGHVLIVASLLLMAVFGDTSSIAGSFEPPPGFGAPDPETFLWIWVGLATAVSALLWWLIHSARKARYRLRYLAPHQHSTLMALAEVLVVGDDEVLTPEQVAENVDDYLHSFPAKGKSKAKLALTALTVYPLLRLRPPFSLMSPESRLRFVERSFISDVAERRLPGFLRRPIQAMLYGAQQLTFIGYYADPRTAEQSGYVPFSKRGRPDETAPGRVSLNVREPSEIDADHVTADVVIVGSGAAGALLAHRLAGRGREVLVLERGRHVDPSRFGEDEREQFATLYADGGMQMSTDARFQVLQGMCVGGTTVVNNAVCFDLPEEVLERWNDPDGLDAGLGPAKLAKSFEEVRSWFPVISQESNRFLGPGSAKFKEGVEKLGLDRTGNFGVVDANIDKCVGCGYCNIGCAFGHKLSCLDRVLPAAQEEFGDAVRIFSECTVERVTRSNGRADGVECKLSDGRRLSVSANTTVVSAGALASSLLLQRSELGMGNGLVGQGLSFNLGAPMTARFEETLNAYDGLQISHYLRPAALDSLILETWFNPVGSQSLFMPGWFSDHYRNMRAYPRMATAGSVVGTRRSARVRPGTFGRGMKLDYSPDPEDLKLLVEGLKLIGRIFLAAGAEEVMPSTFRYLPSSTESELDRFDAAIRDNTDISLHSSHPQGGNPISRDPSKGVVDERFAVHGVESLYVCDASVFPSSITVNPQLTIFALADYAAQTIQ
jgi:choline dehydrogenase-like flavoprotein